MTIPEDKFKELEKYPQKELSQEEFDNLPEYSTSDPTLMGNTFGTKRETPFEWKTRVPLGEKVNPIWFYKRYCPEEELTTCWLLPNF